MEDRLSNTSEFWYTVGLIYSQFQGLMEGYNAAAPDEYVSLTDVSDLQLFFFIKVCVDWCIFSL